MSKKICNILNGIINLEIYMEKLTRPIYYSIDARLENKKCKFILINNISDY